MNTTPTATTAEERIWAVLSHLSALAFGIGIALPVLGWSDQRRKSSYASFQSLQALGYQSLGYTVWALLTAVVTIVLVVTFLNTLDGRDEGGISDTRLSMWMSGFFIFMFAMLGIYIILPIIAAIRCALGQDFRYPIMGNRLARYLQHVPPDKPTDRPWLHEDHEVRWVAAMGHFSILIFLWGMLAPLTALILEGRRSAFLKLQSAQTLLYQAGTTLLYFIAFFLYSIGLVLFIVGIQTIGTQSFDSPIGLIGLLLFSVVLLLSILLVLLVPFLHILGQWAGYRLLKGDDYRYPLLGKLAERWTANSPSPETGDLTL
ncbi:MAG TPA: DUF4870 domain-containing protein [Anaerolineales bacterium]|nr:DUF4870 domain-containing protein [Anaerolineales bacterium]